MIWKLVTIPVRLLPGLLFVAIELGYGALFASAGILAGLREHVRYILVGDC